jgi:putative ABC transport system permease protein
MLGHLLRLAWRNIRRNLTYSVVTVAGLALGICACICIFVIVHFEYSFDAFHPDGGRIYRVIGQLTTSTGDKERFMVLPAAALRYGRGGLTGADAVAGVVSYTGSGVKTTDGNVMAVDGAVLAEASYFDIFSYEWLAGDRLKAMDRPFTVVLTRKKAEQYFGARSSAEYLGRQLVYDDSLVVTVTGIVKDWEGNTDLPFTDFISYPTLASSFLAASYNLVGWGRPAMATRIWVKLLPDVQPATFDNVLAELVRTHGDPTVKLGLTLQLLSAMHFDGDIIENPIRTAHRPTLYGLIAIALAILVLAVVNFVNLSTAYSLQRTKEIGLRKILGSSRGGLVMQLLGESLLLVVLAAVVAIVLVNPVLTGFRSFVPSGVRFELMRGSTIGFLAALAMGTTLLAGLYPAWMASGGRVVSQLRDRGGAQGEKWFLRRGLIVLQFTVSLVFITGSIIIAQQLRFVQRKELGFNADAIVNFGIPKGDSLAKVKTLENMLRTIPGVGDVTRQWVSPMTDNGRGMRIKFAGTDVKEVGVTQVDGDEHFIPLYGIRLVAGRNLYPADSVRELVISETLAQMMGYREPAGALGHLLYWNDKPYPVVGVVADFHTRSMHDPITPVCIINRGEREFNLAVKLGTKGQDAGQVKETLTRIEQVWRSLFPGGVWTYHFYDEDLARLYEQDRRMETLINVAVLLTMFISGIGLFGLTLFVTQKRAREISIRKVLGATVANILMLLCNDIVRLVIIAMFVAAPATWLLANRWLRGFAFHISPGVDIFLMSGVVALVVALGIVSMQAIRTATANPVTKLRTE